MRFPGARWACGLVAIALLLACRLSAQANLPEIDAPDLDFRVSFGFGGALRSGEWGAMRIRLQDQSIRERNLIISVSIPDMEGDTALYQRLVPTNPGKSQTVWLYCRVPFSRTFSHYCVEAHLAKEDSAAPGGWSRDGDPIIRRVVQDGARRESLIGFVGIIGPNAGSLAQVDAQLRNMTTSTSSVRLGGHERVEFIPGLTPAEFPDRWHGLRIYDTLIWASGSPSDLPIGSADAIREWVVRGGHLVIVLGSDAQEWTTGAQLNPLHEILPRVRATDATGGLEPYRAMLTREMDPLKLRLPANVKARALEPDPDAGPWDAIRVLDGADNTCAVIRRLYGCGFVTYIGIDVASPAFTAVRALPDPEVFWYRVLGMRGRIYTNDDTQQFLSHSRTPVFYDDSIAGDINTTKEATAGVLLGFIVFGAYWLVAGPISFALLKKKGMLRHAWVAFVASSLAFTMIAWGGATAIRQTSINAFHVTLVEQVYGQPWSRARSWMNVLVPYYGDPRFAVDPPGPRSRSPEEFTHVMNAWESRIDVVGSTPFPDVREYAVPSADPSSIRYPSRATVKQVEVDWAGLAPDNQMPRVINADGSPGTIESPGKKRLTGLLVHGFDQPITDVRVIHIARQTRLPGSAIRTTLVVEADAWATNEWQPETPLDLASLIANSQSEVASDLTFMLDRIVQNPTDATGISSVSSANRGDAALRDLAFISQMAPMTSETDRAAAVRALTHGWDLGRWFTQPCVIIVGQIARDAESPVPLFVDGVRVPTSGRTIVRWIYPLSENPPEQPESIENTRSIESTPVERPPGGDN